MLWYQYAKNQLASELGVNLEQGLTTAEIKPRLLKYGENALPENEPDGWLKIFASQFKSPLIYILLACAIIVFLLGDKADAGIILVVVVTNAAIGAAQEGKAGKVFRSLKKLQATEATVLRDGAEEIIPESEVVPGDVLVLTEGQKIAADARVIFSYNLTVDESAFTGETGGILKKDQMLNEQRLPVSGQRNMMFKGTNILTGNGRALVAATGINTELGKISKSLLEPEQEIPLQKNIRLFSKVLIFIVSGLSFALFFLGLLLGREVKEMFSLVVSLAVSVIPEGLPLVLTVILASGVWRMSKRNALVKKLQAVEALGQAKVIAVDKTGTITENQMVVKSVFVAGKIYAISGNGYEAKGKAFLGDTEEKNNPNLSLAALIAGLASKATAQFNESARAYKVSGDPTEAAMAVLAEKLGQARDKSLDVYREEAEIPFDYKNKFRAVYYAREDKIFCAVSGAPEVLLKASTHILENGRARVITDKDKNEAENVLEDFSSKAFRVVAFGFKYLSKTQISNQLDGNLNDLVFGGFFGIEDAIRPEARAAVRQAQEAGVKVVMITGDLKTTAKAIAKEAGIFREGDIILTGSELIDLNEQALIAKLPKISVFARVTPEDKMKIIQAYKKAGLIIAMTGDGVNDAPSLVAADLGVAMGKIGTEVAKEAADIVLLDDNLGSIVAAIKEGRIMYQNIKKALQFLFSTSLGELFTIIAALVLQMPVLPILAVQILWLNLITDPLIGASLALEKEEDKIHTKQNKYFLDSPMIIHMAMVGTIMMCGALYLFNLYLPFGYARANTMALTVLAVFQWYNGLNCRFLNHSILHKRIFSNPYLWLSLGVNILLQIAAVYLPAIQKVLRTAPLGWQEWLLAFAFGLILIFAEEIRKAIFRIRYKKAQPLKSFDYAQ